MIPNATSVRSCLAYRERTGSSSQLNAAIENQIIQNIAADKFSPAMIEISKEGRMVHCHHFVAIEHPTSISLWNLFLRAKVWESPLSAQLKSYSSLLLDQKGYVARIVTNWDSKYIEIFFEGKKTGTIFFNDYLFEVCLENGCIFGIGNAERDKKAYNLYQWDQTGELIGKISLAELKDNDGLRIKTNKDFLILHAGGNPKVLAKVFVLNLNTGLHQVFDLEDDLRLGSMFLHENRLVIGSNKIVVFNIVTGKVEKKYNKEWIGSCTHLVANESYAFFLGYRGIEEEDKLYSIDLQTGIQKVISTIPYDIDGEVRISLIGKFLVVCVPQWNYAISVRRVINYETGEETTQKYKHFTWVPMSFESGILLVPDNFSDNTRLYVEDFHPRGITNCSQTFRMQS